MKRTLVCLHGFGVRGFFWEHLLPRLAPGFRRVIAPDLPMQDPAAMLAGCARIVRDCADEDGAPVCLLGHSLGGILGALTARELGPAAVAGVALIAPPWGERTDAPGPLLRFLLRHHLVPGFLTRPRFFGPGTPVRLQKELFRRAVPESPALMQAVLARRPFFLDAFESPLPVPSLVLCSDADRITAADDSVRLAALLGADTERLPGTLGIGHDDFAFGPEAIRLTADRLLPFFGG